MTQTMLMQQVHTKRAGLPTKAINRLVARKMMNPVLTVENQHTLLGTRGRKCKAFGSKYRNYGTLNHFAKVCWSHKQPPRNPNNHTQNPKQEVGTIYNMLCESISGLTPNRCECSEPVTLEHYIFTRHSSWKQRNSRLQPTIPIKIT